MTITRRLDASVRVADATPELPIDELIHDLLHRVHEGAVEHYGRRDGCETLSFSRETTGRRAFGEALVNMGADPDTIRLHLREWDESSRPVAVIHWWVAP